MKTQTLGLLISLSLSLVTAACNDAGSPAGTEASTDAITGIYAVDSYTHNDAACAVGGESQLGSDRFAIVTTGNVFGTAVVNVLSCASPADCRAKVAKLAAGDLVTGEFSYQVLAQAVDGVFLGESADTGFIDGAVCTMGFVENLALTGDGGTLTLQGKITVAADYPALDGGDGCSTDASLKATAGKTCSQLDQLTAHLVETL